MRRWLPWVSLLVLAAAIYDGAIFYSRWKDRREGERAQIRAEADDARKTIQMLGGDQLRILNFYASPAVVPAGGHATVCYGVNAAKTVRIVPAEERVWPAVSHCLEVSPHQDTEYKLIAEDGKGHSVSQSFVLKVAR